MRTAGRQRAARYGLLTWSSPVPVPIGLERICSSNAVTNIPASSSTTANAALGSFRQIFGRLSRISGVFAHNWKYRDADARASHRAVEIAPLGLPHPLGIQHHECNLCLVGE